MQADACRSRKESHAIIIDCADYYSDYSEAKRDFEKDIAKFKRIVALQKKNLGKFQLETQKKNLNKF